MVDNGLPGTSLDARQIYRQRYSHTISILLFIYTNAEVEVVASTNITYGTEEMLSFNGLTTGIESLVPDTCRILFDDLISYKAREGIGSITYIQKACEAVADRITRLATMMSWRSELAQPLQFLGKFPSRILL